jgi:hypothetical protein
MVLIQVGRLVADGDRQLSERERDRESDFPFCGPLFIVADTVMHSLCMPSIRAHRSSCARLVTVLIQHF